jgi:hypothetical protein
MARDEIQHILDKLENCAVTMASISSKTDHLTEKLDIIDKKMVEREQLNNQSFELRLNIVWSAIAGLFSVIVALAFKILN